MKNGNSLFIYLFFIRIAEVREEKLRNLLSWIGSQMYLKYWNLKVAIWNNMFLHNRSSFYKILGSNY